MLSLNRDQIQNLCLTRSKTAYTTLDMELIHHFLLQTYLFHDYQL